MHATAELLDQSQLHSGGFSLLMGHRHCLSTFCHGSPLALDRHLGLLHDRTESGSHLRHFLARCRDLLTHRLETVLERSRQLLDHLVGEPASLGLGSLSSLIDLPFDHLGDTLQRRSQIRLQGDVECLTHLLCEIADERLEQFLMTVGRRKFLMPLYEELCTTPKGRARAEAIYRKARPGYHAVSAISLDALFE